MAGRNGINTHEIYDISPHERRLMEQRKVIRDNLKKDFQKKSTNPYRGVGGYIFDPAVQRFLSMKTSNFELFKPNPKNAAFAFFAFVVPVALLAWNMKRESKNFEDKCRTGQIAYKDRRFKYI